MSNTRNIRNAVQLARICNHLMLDYKKDGQKFAAEHARVERSLYMTEARHWKSFDNIESTYKDFLIHGFGKYI